MTFDLGLQAIAIVAALAIGFGVIVQLIFTVLARRSTTRWLWLVAAAGYAVGAVFVSEVMFATYTVDDIQPIIDGLAFDEALFGGLVAGLVVTGIAWVVTRSLAPSDARST